MAGSVEDVHKGNLMMEMAIKRMKLNLNISKRSIAIFQKNRSAKIKEKDKDEYLGDFYLLLGFRKEC